MKKYLLFAVLALVFASCRTDVDLYIDNGDTTIIYSILDAKADTNFIKVSKSSLHGDYYYEEDDIDVYFTGLFEDETAVDTLQLYPISKSEKGEVKSLYFTTKKLREGEIYEVFVIRHEDGLKVSAKVRTIYHIKFNKPSPYVQHLDFKYTSPRTVEWVGGNMESNFQINAGYFEVSGYFHYRELMPGAQDTVDRSIEWYMGGAEAGYLFNSTYNYYVVSYTPCFLFSLLERDEYLKNNSPYGVQRWLKDFEFRITVLGEELYGYNISNSAGNHNPEINSYTNVENGLGVVCSYTTVSAFHTIDQISRRKIRDNYPYGFYYDPNR